MTSRIKSALLSSPVRHREHHTLQPLPPFFLWGGPYLIAPYSAPHCGHSESHEILWTKLDLIYPLWVQGREQTKFPVKQQKMVHESGLASPSMEQSASTNDDIDKDGNNIGVGGGGRSV